MTRLICFISFLLALNSASAQKDEPLVNRMSWLVGTWKGMYNGQPFYEAWRKAGDNVLVNFTIEIKGKDTVVKEGTAIVANGNKVVFGTAPNQWTLKRLMGNEIMFENDTMRYSNRIIWFHTPDDHWLTILQHPKSTMYYDMIKQPQLEAVVDRFILAARKKD
jgi:hypothetical protein